MNKSKAKNNHDPVRVLAVQKTAAECKCTEAYVRMIINGDYTGGRAEEVRKKYNDYYQAISRL